MAALQYRAWIYVAALSDRADDPFFEREPELDPDTV